MVESTYGDSHPGSGHLNILVEEVRKGIAEEGGFGARYHCTDICDGESQGTDGINYSPVSYTHLGLMWLLLSHSFLQIATATGKVARREYRVAHSRQRSINTALLCREFAHFAASPSYMLNCGLGTFLMPVCAIAVLWKGSELFAVLDAIFAETPDSVPFLLCVMLCSLASMNFMTAPSVSLEGKSLWLLQSLPVEPRCV